MPREAASIAMRVTAHEASAVRSNQPGVGAVSSPPMAVGMSVVISPPDAVRATVRRPPAQRTLAGVSSCSPECGLRRRAETTRSIDAATCSMDIGRSCFCGGSL